REPSPAAPPPPPATPRMTGRDRWGSSADPRRGPAAFGFAEGELRSLQPDGLERQARPEPAHDPTVGADRGADVSKEARPVEPVTVMDMDQAFERQAPPGFRQERAV